MTSEIGDSLPDKTKYAHSGSMSGNDVFRFRNLQQWYTTNIRDVKIDFLRNILDVCGDPLFLFILQKVFNGAYTKDVASYYVGDLCLDVRGPAEHNGRSKKLNGLKPTANDDTDWFNGLSKHDRVTVFVELTLLGGIDVIIVTCNHVNHLIKSNGDVPSLRDLTGKNIEMQNESVAVQDDFAKLTVRLSEKILSKTTLNKHKAKITDVVYRDYVECTNEWKNKLDSFDQKYQANRRTTEPDSNLAQMLPVWHVIPAGGKSLSDPSEETNSTPTGPTSANE